MDDPGGLRDIAVKYALGCDKRIGREIEIAGRLRGLNIDRQNGILIPDSISIKGGFKIAGKGLSMPWKGENTLHNYVSENASDPGNIRMLIGKAARTLRMLHSIPPNTVSEKDKESLLPAEKFTVVNEGDPAARRLVESVLASVPIDLIRAELGQSCCWIHGDCFSYQFLIEETNQNPRLWLCDWNESRIAQTGFFDLAQLWASLEIAITLNPLLNAQKELLWETFQKGYGCDLESNFLFRVLELNALIRYSPRCWKFQFVVPVGTLRNNGTKSNLLLAAYDALIRERVESFPVN